MQKSNTYKVPACRIFTVGLALFGGLCVFAEAVAKKSSVGFITRRMLSQVIQVHKLVMQPHKLAQSPLLSAPVLHE